MKEVHGNIRKTLSLLLVVVTLMCIATPAFAATSKPSYVYNPAQFTDISGHWAEQSLSNAALNGVMAGTTRTTMSPNSQLTRAQVAAMLVRIFEPTERANLFQYIDLNPGAWYYDYIAKAVAMGLMQGSGANMMPDRAINRQEACQLLYNAFHLQNKVISLPYSDAANVSSWAFDAVAACSAVGAIRSTDGMIHPTDAITRAEFASMIYSIVQSYETSQVNSLTTSGVSAIISNGSGRYGNMTLTGNLYIADGIAKNDLSFSRSAINGYMLIRGGRRISLVDDSVATKVVIEGTANNVTFATDASTVVGELVVKECRGSVTLTGNFNKVTIASGTPVYIDHAFVQELVIDDTTSSGLVIGGSSTRNITIDDASIVEQYTRNRNIKDEDGYTYEGMQVLEGSTSNFDIVGDVYVSSYNPLKLDESYGMLMEDFITDMGYTIDNKQGKITISGTLHEVAFGSRNKYNGYYVPIRLMVEEFADEFDVYVNDTKMLSSKDFEEDCIRLNLLIPFSSYYRTAEIRFEPVRSSRYDAVIVDVALASGVRFK